MRIGTGTERETEAEITRFRMDLLRKMPFYGDIVMHLPFIADRHIPTAATDGGRVFYNPAFLAGMTAGQRNFVLMHEVFHVMLFHRKRAGERDHDLWNTAIDLVVNDMLMKLTPGMKKAGIPFERPVNGLFSALRRSDTAETLYAQLLADNKRRGRNGKKVLVRLNDTRWNEKIVEVEAPDDLVLSSPGEAGSFSPGGKQTEELPEGLSEVLLRQLIRESVEKQKHCPGTDSYYVPEQLFGLTESRHIRWQKLLRDFFTEEMGDEASYATPERKYLHMDLILPGYSLTEERIEEIWAFVDSSGSVGKNEMDQFLTQLYRIAKEFRCVFNLCYWDTQVTDVYKKLRKEEDILKSLPKHSGGTDINCVYRWLKENRIKPDVMLILTDGYFGRPDPSLYTRSLARKTILVLSGDITVSDEMKRLGKITRLEPEK